MTEHTVKPERYPATRPTSEAAGGPRTPGGPAEAIRPRAAEPGPPAPGGRDQPLVSVVMPCLNERDSVGRCVRAAHAGLAAAGLSGEVVVADNGSTDDSPRVAAQAGAWVVREPRRGYGNAYLAGFAAARGHYLVMGDSDCSYDFGELPRLLDPLRAGGADYVLGSRFAGDIRPGAMPWTHRRIGNPVLTRMLNRLFGLRTTDAHSGMRAFTRAAYERMAPRQGGMELASELVVAAAASGLRVREVPITYHPRTGTSKLHSLRDAARHVRFMVGYAARLQRREAARLHAGKPSACTPGNWVDPRP
ncbi:glycosyltransferase family 2 protein [Frankia sp. AgB1.9]|uniref:glycosyltransferase family 2 protein n=1 Tax=unclassified Frankia TaxID=2632575 RepID=UPI001933A816|nr:MULTISPECIES: glycosyltransferase family 2 protein [unclassified Frankia]MBL7490076.1 glycosyltransferase family 2 protein [Frankia sp. AgW1.1]MBL7547135.1 glycosyltransferase family 2 protein [Frankia sp. AgB1.9]MBL7620073.1 glycosyltransferase family 2 protein [Frankia sp. AgB1.8]